jgi:hypothetical protein
MSVPSPPFALAISALIVATIWLGIYPQPISEALKH